MRKVSTVSLSVPIGFAILLCSCFHPGQTFTPAVLEVYRQRVASHRSDRKKSLAVSVSDNNILSKNNDDQQSFVLSQKEVNPIITLGKGTDKEKVINSFGLWCAVVSVITGPIWLLSMSLLNMIYKINDDWDRDRKIYDGTGKIWSKTWLTMTDCYPTVSGHTELLKDDKTKKQENTACLFVANHASWMDIPVLCTVLDPVFKFIAKGELKKVPCIGQQLEGGHHILIDRDDRRSQLRTFKEGITWLKKGVPVMAFPEGKRSKDGRLMEFKGGLFAMAVKTGVPIVPISISHTHAVMPSNALLPVQNGVDKLHIHVHAPISVDGQKSEAELGESVRQAFLSTLPQDQHPVQDVVVEQNAEEKIVAVVMEQKEKELVTV